MSRQSSVYEEFQQNQQVFLEALRHVCYLYPERERSILEKMQADDKYYEATGTDISEFLEIVLERHQEKNASINMYFDGPMRSGKSYNAINIAWQYDPTFDNSHIVYDLAQMQLLIPKFKPSQVYVVDDTRGRFGPGSKAEVLSTVTFLEQQAVTGICSFFCSPTIKFTEGIRFFIRALGAGDEYALAMVHDMDQVPMGYLKLYLPDELLPILAIYEKNKDSYLGNSRARLGGSGTDIIGGRVEIIMAERDFSSCSTLQDIKDEIIFWDHTIPANVVGALARKIDKILTKDPPGESESTQQHPVRTEGITDTEYLRKLVEKALAKGFKREKRRHWRRDARYAARYLIPDTPFLTYPDAVSYYKMVIKKDRLVQIIQACRNFLDESTIGELGEVFVTDALRHELTELTKQSQTEPPVRRAGGTGDPDVVYSGKRGPVHINAKLLLTEEDGLTLPSTPESSLEDPQEEPGAPFGNKFGVVVRARACEVRVIPLKFGKETFSMSVRNSVGGFRWLASYLQEHFS